MGVNTYSYGDYWFETKVFNTCRGKDYNFGGLG